MSGAITISVSSVQAIINFLFSRANNN